VPSYEEISDTIEAALAGVGLDAATIERSPSSTIVPPTSKFVNTAGERAMGILSELGATTLERKLVMLETLGEGGMGIVRAGTQRALGREVAVKTLKEDHRGPHSVLKLLREAWVTGGLEHPNVVPVYDIALDPDGTPLIILKKIEGTDWGTLIHDAKTVRDRFGAEDLLEWNLGIFLQVANAVRYAHSRRVLHRDLKPENVMIGRFGEVYLVDWGIAVSLEDDGSGRMPLASEAKEMAGTPLYMAPEMLGGPQPRLSERSDIYLLGAILYEIVTGEPPHRGEHLMELVQSIIASEPEMPDSVPQELARIIQRAMDPDPDARFENAEQLRLAVQAFLRHRDASRLADRAQERLDELLTLLEERSGEVEDAVDREPIYHTFGECRFGFRHALEVWPQNERAREALDRAIQAMVEYELRVGEPEAARALLSEMESVPATLAARVEASRRSKEAEEAKLRRLHEENDPSLGRRTRTFLAIVIGGMWTLFPLGASFWFRSHGEPRPEGDIILGVSFLAVMIGFGVWARQSMTRTAINRRIGIAAIFAPLVLAASGVVSLMTDASPYETMHERFLVWAALTGFVAATIDWRLVIPALVYLAMYFLLPVVGIEHGYYALSFSNAVLLAVAIVLWWRPKEDLEAARQGMIRRREERKRWWAQRFGRRSGTSES
jgi:serine/threonine protein kinase